MIDKLLYNEIVTDYINCLVSNRGAWSITLFSRKYCILIINYRFWSNSKCLVK